MKTYSISNFFKLFFPCTLLAALVACGGGGGSAEPVGGTPLVIPDDVPEEIQPPAPGDNTTLTKDNFVANTSAFYFAAQNLTGVFGIQDGFELLLFSITSEASLYQVRDCSESGDKIMDMTRIPASEMIVHLNDSIDFVYRLCDEGSSTKDGTRSMLVERLDGFYESDNYNVSILRTEDYQQTGSTDPDNNGSYSRLADSTWMSKEEGDVTLYGVNISALNASVPPEQDHEFYTEVEQFPAFVNLPMYETPLYSYGPFAFEMVRDKRIVDGEILKYRWKYDIRDKLKPGMSYSTETGQQIKLAQRVRLDENNAEETYYIALQGAFTITMDTGEVISVQFNNPEASVAPGASPLPEVIATFDAEGDGTVEATEELSFEDFVGAFFLLLF